MKKIIIAALSVLAFTSFSYAQDFKLGIKAGMNFTNLKSDNKWLSSDAKAGYQAGIWGRLGTEKFHIQPEAYFTSKSATIHPNLDDAPGQLVQGDIKFTNIDVPILIGTKFPVGPIALKLQAGPLFSFVTKENNSYLDNVDEAYEDILTNYKHSFASLVVGTGVDILKFSVDLRYEYGLGNISKYEGQKQTLNLWTVSVGFSIF